MDNPDQIVVAGMLKEPGRHESRLSGLDPMWIDDKVMRAWVKVLRVRPLSFASAAKFLTRGVKSEKLRGQMLASLPLLQEVDTLQDADIDFAAKSITDKAKQEHILDRLRWALDSVQDGKLKTAEDAVKILGSELGAFQANGVAPVDISDLAESTLQQYKAAAESGGTGAFMSTGIEKIDKTIGGGKRGELWMVGGYSGDGKTFASFNIAYHRWEQGGTTLWVPNEMPSREISLMFVARHSATLFPESPLDTQDMRNGKLKDEHKAILKATVADIRNRHKTNKRWFVWKVKRGTTMVDIAQYLEGQRYRMSIDLLVIDYLEQLAPVKERRSSYEELNDTLGEAKQFAETYNGGRGLWLLSPHQISRDGKEKCEKRKPNPHYIMSDLASTSRAERDSDVVLWVLRTDKMEATHQLLIGCAKARGAAIRTIRYGFKAMENYASAYIGNLAETEAAPAEQDFDDVG